MPPCPAVRVRDAEWSVRPEADSPRVASLTQSVVDPTFLSLLVLRNHGSHALRAD